MEIIIGLIGLVMWIIALWALLSIRYHIEQIYHIVKPATPSEPCAACEKIVPIASLHRIDSGSLLCTECYRQIHPEDAPKIISGFILDNPQNLM